MQALIEVLLVVIDIYIWLLIAMAILSWLIAFNVLNTRNRFIAMAVDFLYRITEPALRPLRRIIPSIGGLDVSPAVLILILFFVKRLIVTNFYY
ncbi:MAG: YggT family protein [Reyranellaceae bacterium]